MTDQGLLRRGKGKKRKEGWKETRKPRKNREEEADITSFTCRMEEKSNGALWQRAKHDSPAPGVKQAANDDNDQPLIKTKIEAKRTRKRKTIPALNRSQRSEESRKQVKEEEEGGTEAEVGIKLLSRMRNAINIVAFFFC